MRILGLDLGTKTLGIAISDEREIIATGLENFEFKPFDFKAAYQRVQEIVELYKVQEIVIGLPYHLHGEQSKGVEMVLRFKAQLEEELKLPVVTFDERWTTKIATSYLLEADVSRKKRKKVIDKLAAVVILQDYLDRKGRKKDG
ncbi:Holliday junction resolvase RuvX [bacterium]|jgi:putative Holliday junction resolvase|nr:Holliday junction resolvase RuvX [bacterium]